MARLNTSNYATTTKHNLRSNKTTSIYNDVISQDHFNEVWIESQKYLTPELASTSTPYVYHWGSLNTKPKAIIFCIHGLTIHGFAYNGIGNYLAKHGYLVICADQHGFGRFYANPDKNLKDPSLKYYEVLNDFEPLVEKLHKLYPDTKIFCMGESTGGHLTIRFGSLHPELFSGLIISSASMKTKIPKFPLLISTGGQMLFHPLSEINLTKFIGSTMSENPKTVVERMHDPLGRNFLSIEEISKYLYLSAKTKPYVAKIKPTMPVLILQGDIDSIYVPTGSKAIAKSLKSTDKTLKMLPKCGHVLLETSYINPLTAQSVLNWLNQHVENDLTKNITSNSIGEDNKNLKEGEKND